MDKLKLSLELIQKEYGAGARQEVILKKYPQATLKKAIEFNKKGDYEKSANFYWTIFEKEKKTLKKFEYGIDTAQQLINSSSLKTAEKILTKLKPLTNEQKVAVWEKRGWICDIRREYGKALECFKKRWSLVMIFSKKAS